MYLFVLCVVLHAFHKNTRQQYSMKWSFISRHLSMLLPIFFAIWQYSTIQPSYMRYQLSGYQGIIPNAVGTVMIDVITVLWFCTRFTSTIITDSIISVELGSNFSQKQKIFLFGDKLLPVIQQGFLRSAENVYIHNFWCFWENIIPLNFIWWNNRQMLLPFVADVNATV